jgi:hypothetical protein
MTPVDQEFIHKPEEGQHGDCMRACIASVLDLPIAKVPNFAQLDADGEGNYWIMLAEFCRGHGYSFVTMQGRFVWSEDAIYHVISGPSPRIKGGHHAVVGRNGQVFFDPHPSRAGLAGDPDDWKFDLLVCASSGAARPSPPKEPT